MLIFDFRPRTLQREFLFTVISVDSLLFCQEARWPSWVSKELTQPVLSKCVPQHLRVEGLYTQAVEVLFRNIKFMVRSCLNQSETTRQAVITSQESRERSEKKKKYCFINFHHCSLYVPPYESNQWANPPEPGRYFQNADAFLVIHLSPWLSQHVLFSGRWINPERRQVLCFSGAIFRRLSGAGAINCCFLTRVLSRDAAGPPSTARSWEAGGRAAWGKRRSLADWPFSQPVALCSRQGKRQK